ncbi:FMN-linked oxidoreductase [Serendipita vermifera]|nr:FMN-linked oxidoreductase [Serendipita vermifera]
MYEHLAPLGGGAPNARHISLYARWAQGGWGILITGNVQVSPAHLGLGSDLVLPDMGDTYDLAPWKSLAAAMHASSSKDDRPIALMQICHTGRQSPRLLGGRGWWTPPLAPSPVRVGSNVQESLISRALYGLIFQTPKEMDDEDIDLAVRQYCFGATLAAEAGFDGVQIHGSHGYLITQYMSPKTNHRSDEYANPLKFLHRVATAVRKASPSNFVLSVKLNAADYVQGGMTEEQSLRHMREIASWGIFDIVEISGGDYENPEFTFASKRQAFFSTFARKAFSAIQDGAKVKRGIIRSPPLVLLTGSLRGRTSMAAAIRNQHTSLIGLARPSVVLPSYPHYLMNESLQNEDVPVPYEPTIPPSLFVTKFVGAGFGTMWYCYEMRRIAEFELKKGSSADAFRHSPAPALWRLLHCYFMSIYVFILAKWGWY